MEKIQYLSHNDTLPFKFHGESTGRLGSQICSKERAAFSPPPAHHTLASQHLKCASACSSFHLERKQDLTFCFSHFIKNRGHPGRGKVVSKRKKSCGGVRWRGGTGSSLPISLLHPLKRTSPAFIVNYFQHSLCQDSAFPG